MSFSINTNVASLAAQNYLRASSDFQGKTINHVTSGLRIIQSGDDAAGLAIANGFRSDESVLTQGIRNANDGLSQLQIADGGLNNISQLIDRARTLATQSASGTFTGDRGVLNSEFQNVVGEINRQAQAIGLNQGGTFAKSLSVFIGGGKGASATDSAGAIQNGSVGIDLSASTVDAKSLGLQGVQAIGVAGTDIGSGAVSTSLAQILANNTNSGSEQTANFTSFSLKGPGFDSQGIKITVNTQNLGGTSDLVNAVNAAISAAANNGTAQGTALKNAQISTSINTDSQGRQQLTFNSSSAAFQVQAGDRLANALLGNFEQNATVASSAAYQTLDTTGANNTLTFKFDGSANPVSVALSSNAATSKSSIVAQLNSAANFSQSGTAYLSGNEIVIRSKANSATSQVTVTHTGASDALGFSSGSDVTVNAAAASTGASLTTNVQGSAAVANLQNIVGTDTSATQTIGAGSTDSLVLSVGSNGPVTLSGIGAGVNLTKAQVAANINAAIATNGTFTGANAVSASVVNNRVVLTAGQAGSQVTTGAASTLLGFNSGSAVASASTPTFATSDSIKLTFQGGGLTSPIDITLNTTTAGTTSVAQVLSDLQNKIAANNQLAGAGITLNTPSAGSGLSFTSSNGQSFQVQASGDTTNKLGLGSFLAGSAGVTDYTSLAGSSYSATNATASAATLEVSLNGSSSAAGSASGGAITANLTGVGTDATAGKLTGAAITYSSNTINLSGGAGGTAGKIGFSIDGGATFQVTVGQSATTTTATLLNSLNTDATFSTKATATLDSTGTKLVLTSKASGTASSVAIVAASSDTSVTTALGVVAASNPVAAAGANASAGNIVQQLNAQIAQNTSLVNAGLQAVNNSGTITLQSSNSTNFRLNAFGGDIGFGNLGSSFGGNAASPATSIASTFDSNGASASAVLSFNDLLYAGDKQSINITGTDASGGKHPVSITLQNSALNRSGATIDSAISTINTALQQTNDATLKNIVAVKEDVNGTQAIRFLSTDTSFQVSTGATPGGTGITPPTGNVNTSATLGNSVNANIGDQNSAQSAVSALANAVSILGRSQAVVGRGENQFSYAVNLAQSQLTNTTTAESRIRDADLAAEAANLTKAQVLIQAGVAALAQANSAPQQVLSLLRG